MTPNDPGNPNNPPPPGQYQDWREWRRQQRWERRRQRRAMCGPASASGRVIIGGSVLLLGVLFLLQNLGIFYVDRLWSFWPVIVIAMGVSKIIGGPGVHRRVWGVFYTATGLVLLANSLGYLPWDIWQVLWPLWLIFWGVFIILRGFGRRDWAGGNPFQDAGTSTANMLNEVAVFGGVQRRVESQEFEGGEVTAVFGGVEIDLTRAGTKKDQMYLEANAVFGGVELRIPESWDVTMRGAAVLGGHEDKTIRARAADGVKRPRLVINGSAVFGGVTVRN